MGVVNSITAQEAGDVQRLLKCECGGDPQFRFKNGAEGLGVLLEGFGGDGTFEVSARYNERGLMTEGKIEFKRY